MEAEQRRAYNEAVAEEQREQEDGIQRESRSTGGSRASNEAAPGDTDGHEAAGGDEETDEGRAPVAMPVPDGPSNHEREEHELTHVPFRSWCEHCVKGRARSRAHKRRNPETKKEELSRATRVYFDFYYNGIWGRGGGARGDGRGAG